MTSPDPRAMALLTNPAAGRGRSRRTAAIALPRLREAGYRVHSLEGRDEQHARALAAECVAGEVGTLVVCGGDGMVNLAAQEVAGTATRLGIIPAGTGNDVARCLGIPRRDPQAAADVVVGSHVRRLDTASTGARRFVTVLAAGFDALVSERANQMRWARGRARFTLATLAELRALAPVGYTLDLDGETRHLEAVLVAVGNAPSFGGGLRIAEGAEPDDGWLDVVVVRPVSRRNLVRTYPRLYTGSHVHHPQYERHRVRTVTLAAPGIVAYADGERVGPLPLTVRVEPGALQVLAPR